MTSSFATLLIVFFLSSLVTGFLVTMPVLLIYYVFIKRARFYCKVKGELKKVLQEREEALEKSIKQQR